VQPKLLEQGDWLRNANLYVYFFSVGGFKLAANHWNYLLLEFD
jgi:hypothetical protein